MYIIPFEQLKNLWGDATHGSFWTELMDFM
jgi:hypothetical protein